DYELKKPIIIMWPDVKGPDYPYVELYYNERLKKYPFSLFGHIAVNVNGEIFNYSHLLNENEVIGIEEYFYRPALGEFAPHPELGKFNIDDEQKPYYDKFGRLFMRTIHVLHIKGLDTEKLSRIYHDQLEIIHNTPVNPEKPHKYRDMHLFKRQCATIIRDGLKKYGFSNIIGTFPRDVFVNASYNLFKQKSSDIDVQIFKLKQLKVPQADYSAMTPFTNPTNYLKEKKLPKDYWNVTKKYWAQGM
ncbi:hypothetical protein ACFLTD_02235, partial [Elusimicrobiota bacterium]